MGSGVGPTAAPTRSSSRTSSPAGTRRTRSSSNRMPRATSTLYVGIGKVRTKDGSALDYPNPGNARDMAACGGTISEILDLKQVNGLVTDSAGFGLTGVATSNSDPDYSNAGPYTSTAVNKLIIQSSGARNPFGLALDGSGNLWFTKQFQSLAIGRDLQRHHRPVHWAALRHHHWRPGPWPGPGEQCL